eukprot:PRCOL_00005591-RA
MRTLSGRTSTSHQHGAAYVGCHDSCLIPGADSRNISNWRKGYPTHLRLNSEYVPPCVRESAYDPDLCIPTPEDFEDFGIQAPNIPATLSNVSTLRTIHFLGNFFRGQIPDSIFSMPQLSELRLDENQLSGTLPRDLAMRGNLRGKLKILGLSGNVIGGTLPDLSPLARLTELHLQGNDFVGTVTPELFSSHTNFVELKLGRNQDLTIRGGLSEDIFKHTNLRGLDLSGMKLNGTIPESVGGLKHLKFLNLGRNKLTGPLPASFSNLTYLTELGLQENKLSGSVSGLRGVWRLEDLNLANNSFDGEIAKDTFTKMYWLRSVHLEGNAFTGTVPDLGAPGVPLQLTGGIIVSDNHFSDFGTIAKGTHVFAYIITSNNLTDLRGACHQGVTIESLDVSFNPLTGIPPCLCDIPGLTTFIAQNATLKDQLPGCLLTKLRSLALSSNMLTGPLPEIPPPCEPDCGIARHPMKVLALDHNNFSGSIPSSWAQLSDLQVLGLSHNKLQGALPSFHTLPSLRILSVEYNALNETAWTAWASYVRNVIGVFDLSGFVLVHAGVSQAREFIGITDKRLLRQFYIPGTPLLDIFNSTETNFSEIPLPWRQLETLKLSGNDFANAKVTAWDVVLLITLWCPQLTQLDLDDLAFVVRGDFSAQGGAGGDEGKTGWPSDFFTYSTGSTHPLEALNMRNTPAQLPQSGYFADSFRSLHTLLTASDAQQLPSRVPQHILGLASLGSLDLSNTSHTGFDVTSAENWPSLQTLILPRAGIAPPPSSAGLLLGRVGSPTTQMLAISRSLSPSDATSLSRRCVRSMAR